MEQEIAKADEKAEKKQIAKEVSDAMNRMSELSLAKLRGFAAGLQAAEEVRKAG